MSPEPLARRVDRAARPAEREPLGSAILDPTFASRFECKYLVDPVLVPRVRQFLAPFTVPDHFAALCPNYRYAVCSLYLDSPDLALYQQTVCGAKDRFKLRLRTYGDDPEQPAFLEVKRKLNSIVHKRRAALRRGEASRLLASGRLDAPGLSPRDRADAEYFQHLVDRTAARPVLRVKYTREAYLANAGEPVRITIDSDLRHALTLDGNLSHVDGRWVTTPLDGVIVEVKFTERFPWWVQELVRRFDLLQRAVPKYVWSLDHLLLDGRESAAILAGVALPPMRRG